MFSAILALCCLGDNFINENNLKFSSAMPSQLSRYILISFGVIWKLVQFHWFQCMNVYVDKHIHIFTYIHKSSVLNLSIFPGWLISVIFKLGKLLYFPKVISNKYLLSIHMYNIQRIETFSLISIKKLIERTDHLHIRQSEF